MIKKLKFNRGVFAAISSLMCYYFLVSFSPESLIYDEIYYIKIAKEYYQSGLTFNFIYNIDAPTGLLYALVHSLFEPLTNYEAPYIRYVNLLLLIVCYVLVYILLRIEECTKEIELNSAMLLAMPTIGVVACIALTEIPAIAMCLVSTILLFYARSANNSIGIITISTLLASGLFMGLAIWGRQNYIVVWVASLVLFLPINKSSILSVCLYSLPVLFMFGTLIWIWQGLVPPAAAIVGQGFLISHFFISLGYLGLSMLLLFPQYMHIKWRPLVSILVSAVILVFLVDDLNYVPSRFLVERLFGEQQTNNIAYVSGVIFSVLALTFLYSMIITAWRKRGEYTYLYSVLAIVFISISNIKITHQFSSRYTALALPFLILIGSRQYNIHRYFTARFIAGFGLSIFFLLGYYK